MKTKPKTYKFKGKTVIAVPEIDACEGCVFEHDNLPCLRDEMDYMGVPNCDKDPKIIFKLATDENL